MQTGIKQAKINDPSDTRTDIDLKVDSDGEVKQVPSAKSKLSAVQKDTFNEYVNTLGNMSDFTKINDILDNLSEIVHDLDHGTGPKLLRPSYL